MSAVTPALSGISFVPSQFLDDAVRAAPAYDTKIANAIQRTIRCIHGLEHLHRTVDRDELEVYIGRSSIGSLAARWKEHAKEHRGHNYGAVLFVCHHTQVVKLEALAVKVLARLRDRDVLCVGNANVHAGAVGGAPRNDDQALVYMTWKIGAVTEWTKPTVPIIREIASEVARATRDYTAKQIETGMQPLKRLSEYDSLRWWER